jgi:hypothetical protein
MNERHTAYSSIYYDYIVQLVGLDFAMTKATPHLSVLLSQSVRALMQSINIYLYNIYYNGYIIYIAFHPFLIQYVVPNSKFYFLSSKSRDMSGVLPPLLKNRNILRATMRSAVLVCTVVLCRNTQAAGLCHPS